MKYWAYINNEILGPYEKEKLSELPVFGGSTLICPQTPIGEKTEDWKEASTYPEIAAMLGSAPPVTEQVKPVPGAELPGNEFKQLPLHSVDQTPPAAALHIPGADFGVISLSGEKDPGKTVEPQPAPSFTSANFDPMTLSQISKRSEAPEVTTPHQIPPASAPALAEANITEPLKNTRRIPDKTPETVTVPASENREPAAPADKESLNEITSKLETLNRNAITKQDIEPLSKKIDQIGEALSLMKNNQFQREIMEKIHYLEASLSDIKASLTERTSERLTPKSSPKDTLTPAGPKKPPEAAKQEGIDQGSIAKASKIAGLVKKILKFVIIFVSLAAAAGGGAFALKHFGVVDITKYLPFPVPFLSAPQPVETPQQSSQAGENQTAAPQTEPAKIDLSPEIIFIGRTFTAQAGGATLENKIFEDAAARKGDFNRTAWQVKELPNGMFELDAVIPSMDGVSGLFYSYEVDYAKKTVKPMDEASAKPLDAMLKENKAAERSKSRMKKGRQGAGANALKSKQPKPAIKPAGKPEASQVKGKPAAAADDEYDYVYEDETGGTEE